jgi:hypothetical protein
MDGLTHFRTDCLGSGRPRCPLLALGTDWQVGCGIMLHLSHCAPNGFKALIVLTVLVGCSSALVPEGRLSQPDPNAAYPALIDLAPLLAQAGVSEGDGQVSADRTRDLAGRIAALNSRAAVLRGPIIDPATRARMLAGI